MAGPATVGAPLAGGRGRRVDVEHVVAVAIDSRDAVASREVFEPARPVLPETGAQRDLVVLDYDDRWHAPPRRADQPLVAGGGPGRSVARPGERHTVFAPVPEGERRPGRDRHAGAHMADRLDHTPADVAVVEGLARRSGCWPSPGTR